jgi:hypothetical protein
MASDPKKEVVFAYRPILGQIYSGEKQTSLFDYSRRIYTRSHRTDAVVASAVQKVAQRCLGDCVAEQVRVSLERGNYVSTVDHHGPLSHPAFFQPHVLRMILDQNENIPATIVLSCGSVSLDNHTFPRGLWFHGDAGERVRFPFMSLRDRHVSVYGREPFAYTDIVKTLSHMKACPPIMETLTDVLQDVDLYTKNSYRDQITFMNHQLMKRVLPQGGDFVSITIEEVVQEILCSEYLFSSTGIAPILFDADARTRFLFATNGIQTSHDFTRANTTVLFWGLDRGVRVPLRITNGFLTDAGGMISVPFDPYHIEAALRAEYIFPNLALCLLVLSSLGMQLGGGFLQVDYLPSLVAKAKQACNEVHTRIDFNATSDFMGGDFIFLPSPDISPLTVLDYIQQPIGVTDVIRYGRMTTVSDAIDRIIPDVYHILDNRMRNEWEGVVMNTTDLR